MIKLRDLHHDLKDLAAWAGATISTNTDTDGIEIDRQLYNALEFVCYSGTITDGTYALSLIHSDTSGSGYTACSSDETIGAATFAAADDSVTKRIGYNGNKRYVKLRVTSAGTTSGGVFKGAVALLGNPKHSPVADS